MTARPPAAWTPRPRPRPRPAVLADGANIATGDTSGLGAAGLIGFGKSTSAATVGGGTTADLRGGVGGSTTITSWPRARTRRGRSGGVRAAGLGGVSGGSATAKSNSGVSAGMGDTGVASNDLSTGAVLVDALSSADADAKGKAFSFGFAGAVRGTTGVSGNGITVRARHNQGGEDSTAVADAAGVSGGVSIGGASADATAAADTKALSGNATSFNAGNQGVSVLATASNVVTGTGESFNARWASQPASCRPRRARVASPKPPAAPTLATRPPKGTAGGLLAAGTGAGVTTTVNPDVRAGLGDGAVIDVAGGINVTGTANTDADGTAKGVAVSAGPSLGLSKSDVTLSPTMTLRVGSGVNATTHSANTGDINFALTHNGGSDKFGGATSTAFAAGGGIAAGGGADASAAVNYNINATTGSGVTLNAARGVAFSALAGAHVEATGDARGFGLVGGIGGALSNASVTGTVSQALGAVSGTQGLDFKVETAATHVVDATSQASGLGLLAAGQVNSATANFSPTLTANLGGGGTLNVGRDLIVNALSAADTTATAQGRAVSGGIGFGSSIASATMSPSINALTGAEAANVGRNISIRASHNHDGAGANGKDTVALARSSSGSLLASGAGASATANANAATTARSGSGSVLTAGGSLSIHADAANIGHTETSGESIGLLVALGRSVAQSNANGATTAEIGGGSGGSSGVDVRALGHNYADAQANASGGGLGVGVNSGDATAKAAGSVVAGAGTASATNSVTSGGAINILALSEMDANAQARGLSVGLVGAVGVMVANAEVSPTVSNLVQGTTTLSGQGVNVLAQHNQGGQNARAKADSTGIGGGVTVAGSTSTAKSGANTSSAALVSATLNGNGGVVTVQSLANNLASADGNAVSGALAGAARGANTATATSNGTTAASSAAKVNGAGLVIDATANQTSTANSSAAAGGLIAASSGAKSVSSVAPTVTAGIGAGAVIDVNGSVNVGANANTQASGIADGVQFAGGVGAGGSVADVDISPTMTVNIGNNARVTTHGAKGDVQMALRLNNGDVASGKAIARSSASAGSAISVSGSNSTADVTANLTNNTGSGVVFDTSGNVRFDTLAGLTADATGDSLNLGLVGAGGVAKSSATIGGTTNATTGGISGTVGGDLVINTASNYAAISSTDAAAGGLLGSGGTNTANAVVTPTITSASGRAAMSALAATSSSTTCPPATPMRAPTASPSVAWPSSAARTRRPAHNHGNGGVSGQDAHAYANASGGSFGFSGIGANSLAQASADMTTTLGGAGSDLSAGTGDFTVTTRSGNGNARADSIAGGTLTNAQNNTYSNDNQTTTVAAGTGIAAGGNVAIDNISDQGAATDTTAPAGGLIGVAANDSNAIVARNLTTSMLGSGITAGGNILLGGATSGGARATSDADSFGLVSLGKAVANAKVTPTVATTAGGVLDAGGRITIRASHDGSQGASATGEAGGASGFASINGADTAAATAATVSAEIRNGASVNADGGTEVLSAVSDKASSRADGEAYSFGVAIGSTDARSDATSSSRATVGNAQVTGASLTIDAAGGGRGVATALATTGGLLVAGSGAAPVVNVNPSITAELTGGANVDVGGNVAVRAHGNAEGDGVADGSTFAGLGSSATASADIHVTPTVHADILAGAHVKAGGSVELKADQGQAVSTGDTTFGAGGVNTGSNVITLNGDHGLTTGDTVTYSIGLDGNGAVGGLVDGRNYQVIVQSATAVKLGSFDVEHGFVDGQRVIYHSAGNAAISGLVDGQTYFVRVIDPQTIKLATSQAAATVAPKSFLSGAVDATTDRITVNSHGFADGQAVTYRTAGAEQFEGSAVEADGADLITVNSHGFNTGDQVKYTLRDLVIESPNKPPAAITGLAGDGTYYVIRVDANHIKLATTATNATNGTAIDISNTAESAASGHVLTRIGAAPLSGLVSGNTYYVKFVDANTFQLAATSGGAAIDIGAGGGKHTIGVEGIELSGASTSGTHQLEVDITSAGSGNGHQLLGAGGALQLVNSVADNGVSSGKTTGASGALFGTHTGSDAEVNLVSDVRANVGDNAVVQAGGNITLNAFSAANGAGTAGSSGGAFIAVGNSIANVNATQTVQANAGTGAQLTSGGSVSLQSTSTQNGTIDANSKGGGFINSSEVDGRVQLNHSTTAGIGNGGSIVAAHNVDIKAESKFDGDVYGKASSGGLGADSDTDMTWQVGGSGAQQQTAVNVGNNAIVKAGDDITLDAGMSHAKTRVTADSYSAAAGANPDSHAYTRMYSDAVVNVRSGALVSSLENINLKASHGGLNAYSYSEGEADAAGGDTDVDLQIEHRLSSLINAEAGASFETHALDVNADLGSYSTSYRYVKDGAWVDDGDVNVGTPHTYNQHIDFNADARLASGPNPVLLVDAAGNVVTAQNVSVNNQAGVVIVNDIVNTSVGTASFRADGVLDTDPNHPDVQPGTIAGTQSTFTFVHTFNRITLTNQSAKDLRINNIAPVNTTAVPQVHIDVDNVSGPAGDPTPFDSTVSSTTRSAPR
ncbi:hypothetical protein GPALN_004388 [Globodera pallida]|nr:hypothetical protein GPALN_004388 [Globodera pallida]